MYRLTKAQLLADLHTAFQDAKRHKSKKAYVAHFERALEQNLQVLCDELWNRTYQPRPSTCFIITDPKKREVFAADFRDRVVHHLYYNYTHLIFERTFIEDSYSCIKNRGTLFGVQRLEKHIHSCSENYTLPCYVLKMDVRGYFMHINRKRLLDICLQTLRTMSSHRVLKRVPRTWTEQIDMDFVEYMTREIVLLDPTLNCRRVGSRHDWDDLDYNKSLFHSPADCGLPIGNLTSQLLSNVYLNRLDQYCKRELHCKHYGRYVDDFYIVGNDKEWLASLVKPITDFLQRDLGLIVHSGKTQILPVQYGVTFLGMFLKPYRRMTDHKSVERMRTKRDMLWQQWRNHEITLRRYAESIASFRGILSHGSNKKILDEFVL